MIRRFFLCNPILWLTVIYAAFCFIIHFALPKCILDDTSAQSESNASTWCYTEGHDNTILAWATNFFVGAVFAIVGVLLCFTRTNRPLTSGLAFICLSFAFMTRGIIGCFYPNSGSDDGHGQVGYYMLTLLCYTFWTISALFFLVLARIACDAIQHCDRHCGHNKYKVSFGMMILFFVIIFTACGWNSLALWNASDSTIDAQTLDGTAINLPIKLLSWGVLLWNLAYCAFVTAVVYIWRTMARQSGVSYIVAKGLSHARGFCLIVFFQLINAATILLLTLSLAKHAQVGGIATNSIASVVFNFAQLMTGYLVFGFVVALFPRHFNHVKKSDETDSDTDNEHCDPEMGLVVEEQESEDDSDHERNNDGNHMHTVIADDPHDVWSSITTDMQTTLAGMFLNIHSDALCPAEDESHKMNAVCTTEDESHKMNREETTEKTTRTSSSVNTTDTN